MVGTKLAGSNVPLPLKKDVTPLDESRSLTVRRLKALECFLRFRSQSKAFTDAMGHAELVPVHDLSKPCNEVYYFPMLAVRKETRSTSKVHVVFNAFAKTASGTLNDYFLIGPTVHAPYNNNHSITLSMSPGCSDNRCQ